MKNIIVKDSSRFKSVLVSVNMLLPLEADKTGKNALLAMVLKKSNRLYKTEKELERVLASLYDATMDINVEKLDNLYNIQLAIEFLNQKYMSDNELNKIKEIIVSIICSPNITNNNFDKEIFDREKASLIQKIAEEKDDKRKYALECLKQDMFKDTEYGASTIGSIDQVDKITNEELVKHYEYVKNTAEIVVSVVGNLSQMENFPQELLDALCEKCGKHIVQNKKDIEKEIEKQEERIEKQDINQSVLCIGLKASKVEKEDTYALMLYNAILGGTAASKLFQNVREKESLAYFARSTYNQMKHVIYMTAGVDPVNNEKAKDVMLKQLQLIENNEITEEEFYAAKQSLISAYTEIQDSKLALSRNALNNEIYFGKEVSAEEKIRRISNLTVEDVLDIAKKIKATNVFLLGGVACV